MNVKDNIMHSIMRRKLGLFEHICRMDNSKKIKSVMAGMMEGTRRKERPRREWIEDIEDMVPDRCIQCSTDRPGQRSMEKYDGKCNGHLRVFNPWIRRRKKKATVCSYVH